MNYLEKSQIEQFEKRSLFISAREMGIGLPARLSKPALYKINPYLIYITALQYSKSIVKVLLGYLGIFKNDIDSRSCNIHRIESLVLK